MKRIFAIQTDTAGCFMYRLYWPLIHLDRKRFEVHWGAPGPDIFDYDIVIGQRIAGENQLWRDLCDNPNVMAVYDLDDDLLHVDPENTVPYSIYGSTAESTLRNILKADKITVSTPALEAGFAPFHESVHVLPNCLPQSWMQYREPPWPPIVGWAGSMFHAQDWNGTGVAGGIIRYVHGHPGATFHTIGARYLNGIPVRYTPWSTMEAYHAALDFSVGVAPLMVSPFNRSKSHCKVLEYASKGIPAIATDLGGQYVDFIEPGVNGYLVKYPEDWYGYLMMATNDQDYLRELGRAAYQKALTFTIERNIHLWESVYES
jgi:Glycosyltransferase